MTQTQPWRSQPRDTRGRFDEKPVPSAPRRRPKTLRTRVPDSPGNNTFLVFSCDGQGKWDYHVQPASMFHTVWCRETGRTVCEMLDEGIIAEHDFGQSMRLMKAYWGVNTADGDVGRLPPRLDPHGNPAAVLAMDVERRIGQRRGLDEGQLRFLSDALFDRDTLTGPIAGRLDLDDYDWQPSVVEEEKIASLLEATLEGSRHVQTLMKSDPETARLACAAYDPEGIALTDGKEHDRIGTALQQYRLLVAPAFAAAEEHGFHLLPPGAGPARAADLMMAGAGPFPHLAAPATVQAVDRAARTVCKSLAPEERTAFAEHLRQRARQRHSDTVPEAAGSALVCALASMPDTPQAAMQAAWDIAWPEAGKRESWEKHSRESPVRHIVPDLDADDLGWPVDCWEQARHVSLPEQVRRLRAAAASPEQAWLPPRVETDLEYEMARARGMLAHMPRRPAASLSA